jgi:Restriction Enzyme Adenine Methylase Associated
MAQGSSQQDSPGKRSKVSVKDLIDAGLLQPSQELQFGSRSNIRAKVTSRGTILFKGVEYSSPSPAASQVNGTSINGWVTWRFKTRDAGWVTLSDLRSRAEK